MYFSMRLSPNHEAEKVVKVIAGPVGEQINAEIKVPGDVLTSLPKSLQRSAFEATAIKIARREGQSVTVAAKTLMENLAQNSKLVAPMLRVGLKEIFDSLGGQEKTVQYYQDLLQAKYQVSFQSVGLIADDLTAVKNRAAMLATRLAYAEVLKPKRGGVSLIRDMERDYLEFHKSIQTVLDLGVSSGALSAVNAKSILREIASHAIAELAPDQKERIINIHAQASKAITDEARKKVMAKYSGKTPSNEKDGPSLT